MSLAQILCECPATSSKSSLDTFETVSPFPTSSLPNAPCACVQKQALGSIHGVARAHLHTQGRRARSSHLPGKRVATRHDENQLTRVQSVRKTDHDMHIIIIQQYTNRSSPTHTIHISDGFKTPGTRRRQRGRARVSLPRLSPFLWSNPVPHGWKCTPCAHGHGWLVAGYARSRRQSVRRAALRRWHPRPPTIRSEA